jgi:hypothetical protein
MNRKPEHDELLGDIFAEATDFREAMLGETLRRVRRRRQFRRARRAATLCAIAAVLLILLWRNSTHKPNTPRQAATHAVEKSYTLVRTRPLAPAAIVSTHALGAGHFSFSGPPVQIVQTQPGQFRFIGDDELLTLMAPRPVVLVRIGPHAEKLVFANPEDERRVSAN